MRTRARSLLRIVPAAAVLAVMVCCGGIPDNFESLPLERKVAAYSHHLAQGGRPRPDAQSWISWHGQPAADLMAGYLEGKRSGLPAMEAIQIIRLVQVRGCALRGTAAERALEDFRKTAPKESVEQIYTDNALDVIRRNFVFRHGPDTLKGGPCEDSKRRKGARGGRRAPAGGGEVGVRRAARR